MLNNYEFISYIPTPEDKYGVLGVAEILIDGKYTVRFKHVNKKDGSGQFFASNSFTIGEKPTARYLDCFEMDSSNEKRKLQEFLHEGYKQVMTIHKNYAPISLNSPSATQTSFQSGGSAADEQPLPF
jgi:hypothetical protein